MHEAKICSIYRNEEGAILTIALSRKHAKRQRGHISMKQTQQPTEGTI